MKNVFLSAGGGCQFYQMGWELYQNHSGFQNLLNQLNHFYLNLSGISIIDCIFDQSKQPTDIFSKTAQFAPAIFSIEYALAQTLIAEGIKPDICLGSSLGEYCAATLSGYLEPETALKLIFTVTKSQQILDSSEGMLAIFANSELFFEEPILYENSDIVSISTPLHFTIGSNQKGVEKIKKFLTKQEIDYQGVPVPYGVHSRFYKIDDNIRKALDQFQIKPPTLTMMSGMYGQKIETLTLDYFADLGRNPIRTVNAIRELEKTGNYNYIDISPSSPLTNVVKYNINSQSQSQINPIIFPYQIGGELERIEKLKSQIAR